MAGEQLELVVQQTQADEMKPYERLLRDALRGDPTLFVSEDSVEAA
jgi:glucose-6-phosphate 1-dehydrogenase